MVQNTEHISLMVQNADRFPLLVRNTSIFPLIVKNRSFFFYTVQDTFMLSERYSIAGKFPAFRHFFSSTFFFRLSFYPFETLFVQYLACSTFCPFINLFFSTLSIDNIYLWHSSCIELSRQTDKLLAFWFCLFISICSHLSRQTETETGR